MDPRLKFIFDENLRDIPADPVGLRQYVQELKISLGTVTDSKKRVSLLGEIGVESTRIAIQRTKQVMQT